MMCTWTFGHMILWCIICISYVACMPPLYEDPISYDDLLTETTQQTSLPNANTYAYDYDESDETNGHSLNSYWSQYKMVLMNTQMKIECPLHLKSSQNKILNKFKFGEIMFYKSIHDFNLVNFNEQVKKKTIMTYDHENTLYFKLKSKKVFKALFSNLLTQKSNVYRWQTNKLVRNNTRYSDSGRYYCVYSYKSQYLITGNLYIVYEGNSLFLNLVKF